ncbi:MAG: hypothetical protein Q7W45_13740 [Bacteroidota bacterium]|nr:hypothetical protein [Bacteroidota bacterium]MDP3144416.1 hypothetical protein [Bacteroidota bacterium]
MQKIYILFLLFSLSLNAQDKLFYKNGNVKKGYVVSVTKEVVFFKNSDTSIQTQQIPKTDLLLLENYKGDVFIFANDKKTESEKPETKLYKRNALGVQPFAVLFGRVTLVYERFTKDNKIGFVFPLSLTFDPMGSLYNSRIDTNRNSVKRLKGVNFIGGLDVNFYVGRRESSKFFVGPRIRYGTDMFLRGIEAYSLQTQLGWKYSNPKKSMIQHLSFGFGFVRILSSPAGPLISPKQSYGWYSINYRVGIKW